MVAVLDRATIGGTLTLGDTNEATVRLIASRDAEALVRFHAHLSRRSIQMRYFYPHLELKPDEVEHLTQVDGTNRVALVVEQSGDLLAIGRYDRLDDPAVAEVAFVVADELQHHGIAPLLLQGLASRAREVGITTFRAEVLAENAPMLGVFRQSGFPMKTMRQWGTVSVTMELGRGGEGGSERGAPDEPGPSTVR
jgi:GNAT superfamily N-acetyltransferase